jgi:hypothetical protein
MQASFTGQAVRLAVILALVGSPASATWAQGPAAESAAKPALKKISATTPGKGSAHTAKPGNGSQEGIKVHGHWTITIRNEDGSVASRHEFKNALANFSGLPLLLAHGGSVGQWRIAVFGPTVPLVQPCQSSPLGINIPRPCVLGETNGPQTFGTLQVTASATELTIRGSVQAQASSPLAVVHTEFDICTPAQGPSLSCQVSNLVAPFTQKDISAQGIQVAAGQTIDISVVISFS